METSLHRKNLKVKSLLDFFRVAITMPEQQRACYLMEPPGSLIF